MYYPDELIEEVRSKNDIVEVISGYVRMQKKGSAYFGLCPFHSEKSPSFSVSGAKQMYYCFGCGAGGNVFTFLMNYENFTFRESIQELANRAGIDLPELEYSESAKKEADKKGILLEINKEAAKYFYYQLRQPQGKIGYEYLLKRELSQETIHKFGLGFANKTSNDLVAYLKSKGYKDQQLVEAGLAGADEKYGLHDKFWNRVIFPIMDINHRAIGFGGRVMGDGNPKYLNSPETLVFDKSRNLYGLNFARTSRKNHMILCEGYMDVISLHQAGFTQAVASLGTAFTMGQATLLKRYTETVLLAYDSDEAGTKAALRALNILRETGLMGKVIDLKPYKDPDELIKNLGAEEFSQRLDKAENGFLFEIRVLQRDFNLKDPEEKTRFHREIAKRLCQFSEEVERDNYLEAVAASYHIGYENLRKLMQSYALKNGMAKPIERPKSGIQSKNTQEESIRKNQRLLITWLVEEPYLYTSVKDFLSPEDFTDELYREVAEKLFEELKSEKFSPAGLVSMFEEEEKQREVARLFNTKLNMLTTKPEREKAFHDILIKVKEQSLEYYSGRLGSDVTAINRVISGKVALENLKKTHISLKE
ncbi:MAG: DNA primase [Lachnospiraceae bacterium]|nr:DNA primase [Lachnospiraceae bacterium]